MMIQHAVDDLAIPSFLIRKKGPKGKPLPRALLSNKELVERELKAKEPSAPKLELSVKKHVPNVQEALREKSSEIISIVEGMIDDGDIAAGYDFYEYLRSRMISQAIARRIADHFEPRASELYEILAIDEKAIEDLTDDDQEMIFAYRGYTADEILSMVAVYQSIIDDCNRFTEVEKKTSKQRVKKPPSVERILKNFKYAEKNEKWKIASVNPASILGAAELWTFNVNNLAMTVYRAKQGGLQVKGPHIENVDDTTSESKRVGRRTEEKIRVVLDGGKVTLRKFFESINGQSLPLTRIGKNVILLRVIKF